MSKNYFLLFLLFILSMGCSSKQKISEKEPTCDCPLELVFTNVTQKDSSSNSNNYTLDGNIQIKPELASMIKSILKLEAQLNVSGKYQNQHLENSSVMKTLENNPSQEILDVYLFEGVIFCTNYKLICESSSIPDSSKTERYRKEWDILSERLRKALENPRTSSDPSDRSTTSDRPGKTVKQRDSPQIQSDPKKESGNINAPNALIITQNQSGGTNTVVTPIVDLPDAKIEVLGFEELNVKTDKIQKRRFHDSLQLPTESIKEPFVYLSKASFSYQSKIARNELFVLIKNTDIVSSHLHKSGRIMAQSGKTKGDFFAYILKQPENGIYLLTLYSKKPIPDIEHIFEFK